AGAGPPVSGSGEIGGAAVVELGGSGPPGEQGPAGLEVPARGELAEEDGVEAETVQERSHPVRGTRIVGGDGERPTLRVALVAAVVLDVVVADVVEGLHHVRPGQARSEQLARGQLFGEVADLAPGGGDRLGIRR